MDTQYNFPPTREQGETGTIGHRIFVLDRALMGILTFDDNRHPKSNDDSHPAGTTPRYPENPASTSIRTGDNARQELAKIYAQMNEYPLPPENNRVA